MSMVKAEESMKNPKSNAEEPCCIEWRQGKTVFKGTGENLLCTSINKDLKRLNMSESVVAHLHRDS